MKKIYLFCILSFLITKSYGGIFDSLSSMLSGESEIKMNCSGTLSISNPGGVINSVPVNSSLRLVVTSEGKSLNKKVNSLSVDGKVYQICKQDNIQLDFLESCSKEGRQPFTGEGGSNNYTNHFSFNKVQNSLKMDSIFRSGYMFVSDKSYSLSCQ
jgi:hypothetical protein